MYRIGIIGADTYHASAFAGLLNIPVDDQTYPFPNVRVTAIVGETLAHSNEVAKKCKIHNVYETPEELLGLVDAVMIVSRNGNAHLSLAAPFLKAGIPVWVDKPYTLSSADARAMCALAELHGGILTGGSTLKHIPDVMMLKRLAQGTSSLGKIRKANLSFSILLDSEYGLGFYASHLVEVALHCFGYDPTRVFASRVNDVMTAILDYDHLQVTLDFMEKQDYYYALLYGEHAVSVREINIHGCYHDAFAQFYKEIQAGHSDTTSEMIITPVELVEAIEQSLAQGKQIQLRQEVAYV